MSYIIQIEILNANFLYDDFFYISFLSYNMYICNCRVLKIHFLSLFSNHLLYCRCSVTDLEKMPFQRKRGKFKFISVYQK